MKFLPLLFLPLVGASRLLRTPQVQTISNSSFNGVGKDRIRGLSIFGLETEHRAFMCDWVKPIEWQIKKLVELGFNSLRIPFSYVYVKRGDFSQLDKFMTEIKKYPNVSVVLDFHRISESYQSHSPVAGTCNCRFGDFLNAWSKILKRYYDHPNLLSLDIWNEYQGDDDIFWHAIATHIIEHIESEFPNRFIYQVQGSHWGGNIRYTNFTELGLGNRIKYVSHKYEFSGKQGTYEDDWNWSILANHDPTSIIIGEYGYISSNHAQTQWANRFIKWLSDNKIYNSYFWVASWNSGDTQGLFKEDCTTIDMAKMELLNRYWNS
jgi:endoglucanase